MRGPQKAPIALQSVCEGRTSWLAGQRSLLRWAVVVHTRTREGEAIGFFISFYTRRLSHSFKFIMLHALSLSHPQGCLDRSKAGLPRSVRHGEPLPLAGSPGLMHCSEHRLGGGEEPRSQALRCPGSKQHLVSLGGQRALPASIKPVFLPGKQAIQLPC